MDPDLSESIFFAVVIGGIAILLSVLCARSHLGHELLTDHRKSLRTGEPATIITVELTSDQVGERVERGFVFLIVHEKRDSKSSLPQRLKPAVARVIFPLSTISAALSPTIR